MKKLRLFLIIGFAVAIVSAIAIYTLVSYLNYESYRQAAEAALALPTWF